MLLCFVVKTVIWYKNTTATPPRHHPLSHSLRISANLARSHDIAQNDNRPYHFCAKNEYIDGQFLAGGYGSRQRHGADVVFTDTPSDGSK